MQLFVYILSLNFWLNQRLYEEQMHTLQYNPDGSNLEMKKVWDVNFWAEIMAVPSGPVKKMKSTSLWRRVGKNSKIGNPPLQGIEEKYLPVWHFYGAIRGFWDPWNDPLMRRFAIENNLMYAAFQSVKWTNQYNTNNAGGSN